MTPDRDECWPHQVIETTLPDGTPAAACINCDAVGGLDGEQVTYYLNFHYCSETGRVIDELEAA